jgi:arylsulfatase A-like enzyme/Flp pilus assembly protein TadD
LLKQASTAAVGLLALFLLVAVWWRMAPARHGLASGALRGCSVLLVTIDTLRADRVGAYGRPGLTPTLDALAAKGLRFGRASAHAPMTLPSHASILTGLTPPAHGVRNNGSYILDPSRTTLAQILRDAGYRTGAFVGSFALDARFGLGHGFDVYDDYYGEEKGRLDFGFVERRAPDVLRPAEQWILKTKGAAWFAWIHLFDPHAPYDAPERRVSDPYDNEVAFTDAHLGRFLDSLRQAGHLDRTLIVVTADHGESLGEHGETTHGLFAYEATLRVPLIVTGPGIAAAVVRERVGHVDLVPTILDLLGVPAPLEMHGRSLRSAMNGAQGGARPIYFEALDANLTRNWAPLTGLVERQWKYVDLPLPELYDLDTDPREMANLATREPDIVTAMRARLDELRAPVEAARAGATSVDPDTAARLRSLGYLASIAPKPVRPRSTEADDPKNLVELNQQYALALEIAADGRLDAAMGLLRRVIARRSDFAAAYTSGATILIQAGRPAEAVTLLDAARHAGVETPELTERRGAALLASGAAARAISVLEPFVTSDRASADARNTLALAYLQRRRPADARRLFEQILSADPSAAGAWNNLGLLEIENGNRDAAAAAFKRAVDADPSYGPAWQGLGAALLDTDRTAAVAAWMKAVDLMPDEYDTLFNVGMLLADSPQPSDALPYLRRFVDRAPASRYARDIARVRDIIAKLERSGS